MINLSIDLNKIDKSRIKNHTNGAKYYNITLDKLKEVDKFGNTHCVYESQSKEEREAKAKRNYVGNGREFIFGGNKKPEHQQAQNFNPSPETIDDLPF